MQLDYQALHGNLCSLLICGHLSIYQQSTYIWPYVKESNILGAEIGGTYGST